MLVFVPNFLGNVGISLATSSFFYLVCAFSACAVCTFVKTHYEHILTSKIRVLIQAASTILGLLVFALLPSAKTLVITSALLGISLGIHDFYYIYALYLICAGRIRTNLRKCAEYTFYFGIGIVIPISMTAFMVDNVRIVMLIVTVLVALVAFIYPASAYSSSVDDSDPSLKPEPRRRQERSNPMPNPYAQPPMQPAQPYAPQSAFGDPGQPYQAPVQQYQPEPPVQQFAPEQPAYQQPQQYAPVQPAYQQPVQQYAPVQPQYQPAPQPEQYQQQYQYQQEPQMPYGQTYNQQAPVQPQQYDQQMYQPQGGPDMYGQNPYPQQPADPMAFLNDNDPGNGGM